MQINSSPHIQPQVQTAEADLLKALGQNLEGAQNGELTGEAGQEVDFAGLLAEELEEKPSKEENIKPEEIVLEQKTPEQKIPSELSQIIGTQKTPVVAADKEIVAKENPQTLVKNPATTPSEIAPKSIAA